MQAIRAMLALWLYGLAGHMLVWAMRLARSTGDYHIVLASGGEIHFAWHEPAATIER